MKIPTAIALLFSAILILAGIAAAQGYSITDLGVLAGDTGSEGLGLNSNGVVAGCSDMSTLSSLPCVQSAPGKRLFGRVKKECKAWARCRAGTTAWAMR